MNNTTETHSDTIIDLDADQVIERTEPAAPTAAKKASRTRGWLYGAVAMIAAAIAGGWLYKDVLSNYLPSDQMVALSDKVTALEAGNATLRGQLENVDKLAAQLKADVDTLEAKEATLSTMAEASQAVQSGAAEKLTALEESLNAAKHSLIDLASRPVVTSDGIAVPADTAVISALTQRIGDLEKDVASLKVKPAEAVDNTVALSQGLSDLKAKIAAGTGYRDEYERIQRMVPAAAGLDVLQQHAALGLPDAKGLGGELKAMIGSLPKPIIPGPVPESQSWWSDIYNSFSDLITIRVEGDVDWPTAASAAAALAESGDLPQAIEQLSAIEGAKPGGIQQWLDRAQGRVRLETALKSVEDAVLRVIAAKG